MAYKATNAGLAIMEAAGANNGNTVHSIKITDPDAKVYYYQILLANLKFTQRNNSTQKGLTFIMRMLTDKVEV